jgi:hypothetical protein
MMEILPYYMEGGVEPLSAEAIALVCDADRRDSVREQVLLVRIR